MPARRVPLEEILAVVALAVAVGQGRIVEAHFVDVAARQTSEIWPSYAFFPRFRRRTTIACGVQRTRLLSGAREPGCHMSTCSSARDGVDVRSLAVEEADPFWRVRNRQLRPAGRAHFLPPPLCTHITESSHSRFRWRRAPLLLSSAVISRHGSRFRR